MAKELYSRLGVKEDATLGEINSAYKKLARQWHPDRNLDNQAKAAEVMKKLNQAAEILRDERNRKAYDEGRINDEGQPIDRHAPEQSTRPNFDNDFKQPNEEQTQPTFSQRYKKSRQHFFNDTPPSDFFFFKSREDADRFVPTFTQQPSMPPRFYATPTPLSTLLEKIRSYIVHHHNAKVGKTENDNNHNKQQPSSDEFYQHKKADKHQPEHVHIRTMDPLLMELVLQQLIVDLVILQLSKHQAQPDDHRPSFGMGR